MLWSGRGVMFSVPRTGKRHVRNTTANISRERAAFGYFNQLHLDIVVHIRHSLACCPSQLIVQEMT
jgi:hypothetical protein